jgi:3-deoxy-D-arabino-heptulosonate 7-phosphate (DAHP) synthase
MKKELQLESISTWLPTASKPVVISGPCSAETESQMVATAKQLPQQVKFMRCVQESGNPAPAQGNMKAQARKD